MGHLSQMVAPCTEENHITGKLNYLMFFFFFHSLSRGPAIGMKPLPLILLC